MLSHRRSGFTLIELMIVVAIIAVIAAISIPSLVQSRMRANEASAIGDLRAVMVAEIAFNTKNYRFTADFAELLAEDPPHLGGDWVAPRNGYLHIMEADDDSFSCVACPSDFGRTGNRDFFIDLSGVIRYDVGGNATVNSPPLGEQ